MKKTGIKKISIDVVPHADQRYDTSGDWELVEDVLYIRVSDLGDWKKEMSVAVHELVEAVLCKADGVSQASVDDFDFDYEEKRAKGVGSCQGEPGDDARSPYREQHCFATAVERMLCAALGVAWADYEKEIQEVSGAD